MIQPGPYVEVLYNTTHIVNAYDFSYDPDEHPSENKRGLQFSAKCEKNKTDDIFDTALTNVTFRNAIKAKRGCFGGDTAGPVDFTGGKAEIDSSLMFPMTFYTFTVEVRKDTRSAEYELQIYIPTIEPPVLEIRSVF